MGTDLSELGRFMVTRNRSDIGAFRTPHAPQHRHHAARTCTTASLATLWDVMDHYNKGGEANPFLDGGMEPLALTETEIDQVVAFLFTLTDDRFAEREPTADGSCSAESQAAKDRPFRDDDMAFRRTLAFEERIRR